MRVVHELSKRSEERGAWGGDPVTKQPTCFIRPYQPPYGLGDEEVHLTTAPPGRQRNPINLLFFSRRGLSPFNLQLRYMACKFISYEMKYSL